MIVFPFVVISYCSLRRYNYYCNLGSKNTHASRIEVNYSTSIGTKVDEARPGKGLRAHSDPKSVASDVAIQPLLPTHWLNELNNV